MKMRFLKNNKGFTLVEVIVVAVIVAVLAAVAIPLYIGYVNDSTVNMCTNLAADLATAVSSGINSGATAVSGSWPGDNVGPVALLWTMPAAWMAAGGANIAPIFRIPNGITVTTTGTGLVANAGTIIAWKTGKPLLKGTTANY